MASRARAEIRHWTRREWSFEDVGDHWDSTKDYDAINKETYSYFRRFEDGLRISSLAESGRILDFCSRTGNGTAFFSERGKVESAVCADVSFGMRAACLRRLKTAGLKRWLWMPVDDYKLALESGSFDSVLCFETVEHFPRPELLLQEIGRVIKVGGGLIVTTPNVLWEPIHAIASIFNLHHSEGPHRFIRLSALKAMIERAGFRIVRSETTVLVPGGPKAFVRIGEWIENHTRSTLMPSFGLRRVIYAIRD